MSKLHFIAYPAVAALAIAAAFSAHAEGPLPDIGAIQAQAKAQAQAQPQSPGRTRAEVKAELARAIADGSYQRGGAGYDPLAFLPRETAPRTMMAGASAKPAQ